MKIAEFNEFFERNSQFDREAWFAVTRPCIDIYLNEADEVDASDSYFGGQPFLPEDFVMPTAPKGCVYEFIGQINLAHVPRVNEYSKYLPENGVLSFFYLEYGQNWDMGDYEPFWGDEGYVKAFYFPNGKPLQSIEHSTRATPPQKISFEKGLSLPCSDEIEVEFPQQSTEDFYEFVWETEALDLDRDHLFGYPNFDSLGYDPTPKEDDEIWIPLLNIKSHDSLKWCWHDGDKLMTFIRLSDLQTGNFDNIKSDAG